MAVAPITVVMDGQTTTVAVTDVNGVRQGVYLDSLLTTLVTQPYRVTGRTSATLWRNMTASTETLLVTALIEGEAAARQTVTLTPAGVTVTLADAPTSIAISAYVPLAPVQRGVWAPTTAYALADIAISPTGDIITPKVTFTSAGAYSAADWNIVVPAQNYGRELTGAESSADLNLLSTAGSWTDVPGMTGTIPAGIPFTCEINALCAAVQGTAAANSITGIQLRVVDAATATTLYGFAWRQLVFSAASGMTLWQSVSGLRRGAGLGTATAVKMQAQAGAVTGQGNIGLFPASGGGGEPTTLVVRGR